MGTGVAVGALAVLGEPAAASHESPPCIVVSQNTTLTGDVGFCKGHGIVVAADNVTVDLAGYKVRGAKREAEQVGILLDGVSGVTVKNGTVSGFDAGVAVEGGGGNTIMGMTVKNNVNDMIETLDPRSILVDQAPEPTPEQMEQIRKVTCNYGDGITTFDSSNNIIQGNTVTGNGPYSGISLVGDSNGNKVRSNRVHENDLLNNGVTDGMGNPVFVNATRIPNPNTAPGQPPTVPGPIFGRHVPAGSPDAVRPQSMCGATEVGTPGMGRGREVQSIGIRVEGPGADGNQVDLNTVTKGGLAGISFHSFVLIPAAPNVPVGSPNVNNTVSRNNVSRTGEDTSMVDPYSDGIASLSSGPIGTVTRPSNSNIVVNNFSHHNVRNGIGLDRLTFGNNVSRNTVASNGSSGIFVAGPTTPNPTNPTFDPRGAFDNFLKGNKGSGNGAFDGTDRNPACDNNKWLDNAFLTVNQACVDADATVVVPVAVAGVASTGAAAGTAGMAHSRS